MRQSNWHGGKGSTPRTNTSSKEYQDNWDKIFNKEKEVFKEFNGTRKGGSKEVDEKEIDKS